MSSAGTSAPAAKVKQSRTTDYVILEFNQTSDEWKEHGDRIAATSAEVAIRKHAEAIKSAADPRDPRNPRTFIAVPARSFQPVKVTAEVQTTIKLATA